MTDAEIRALYQKHGATSKFVRAYCKAMGWRHDAQGAPSQWYARWPQLVKVLVVTRADRSLPVSVRSPSG